MTPEEFIAALHAPRLPEGAAGLDAGALVAAFGLGLLIAFGFFALVRPAFRARRGAPRPGELLAGLAALPEAARPLAAARLFSGLGAPVPETVARGLYRPGAKLDTGEVEAALARAWAGADGAARRAAHV
ncbi:MAG: hypothetical protein DI556_05140 [Rhodovulum sulfidophilum]|uniref:Uncharacterized protein n=1 Tax=Rhodovulum sulfidophilum TaxID=35806 RepID=A0A2W5NDC4_RHOSU|nr:MAG: hypothetical protein DI556_05140 [Rhodovulum sulfidophilum]